MGPLESRSVRVAGASGPPGVLRRARCFGKLGGRPGPPTTTLTRVATSALEISSPELLRSQRLWLALFWRKWRTAAGATKVPTSALVRAPELLRSLGQVRAPEQRF